MAAPLGFSLALTDHAFVVNPTWTRIDTGVTNPIIGWSIQRGRSSELDKPATGTASVKFKDINGLLDPTNATSPYFGNLDPVKQAAIALYNPVTTTWSTLFRGFTEEISGSVDVSEKFIEGQIDLVDAMELFNAAEIIPDDSKHLIPGESPGEVYYHVSQVDDRIKALLDDADWPDNILLRSIFSGNIEIQGVIYAPRSSLLSALQDAADAEFPGVANFYISKEGKATFHGRLARFNDTDPTYNIAHWSCGDTAAYTGNTSIIPLFGLDWDRSKNWIYNRAIAYPQWILDQQIAGQQYDDATSQGKYGVRSLSFENLLTNAGDTGAGPTTGPNAETKLYAKYYVDNYKNPQTRINKLVFRPVHPTHPNAAILWNLMCNVELNDVIHVKTTHVGGGGFDADYFVEGINYEAEPMNDQYPNITLTLDVSPKIYYSSNPF